MEMEWLYTNGNALSLLNIYASTFSTNFKDPAGQLANCVINGHKITCSNLT